MSLDFKQQLSFSAEISDNGYIIISQYDESLGQTVSIELSPPQFKALAKYIFELRSVANALWNNGIEDFKEE